MIRFEKVSFEEFKKACISLEITTSDEAIKKIYDNIKLPMRSTSGSAGYDFYSPFGVHLTGEQLVVPSIITRDTPPISFKHEYLVIPTGIRFVTDRNDIVLVCVPRSGLGFKFGVKLRNTLGVIDSDYQFSDNEGHIMAKIGCDITNDIEVGKAFMQGIILPYITVDDEDTSNMTVRNGGFGSTDKKDS